MATNDRSMPTSTVSVIGRFAGETPDEVFARVTDIERFPALMGSVQGVDVLRVDGGQRDAEWEVTLRGSLLRWRESATIDRNAHVMTFQQTSGDLDVYRGTWRAATEGSDVLVYSEIEFRIGIPLLHGMLQPIAELELLANLEDMILGLGGVLDRPGPQAPGHDLGPGHGGRA